MKDNIKKIRLTIDSLAQLTGDLPIDDDRAKKSLYFAKAWLGKCLGELGQENPYGSGYKTKDDIVPTQDVAKNLTVEFNGGWQEMNHVQRVDYLRTEIEKVVDEVKMIKTSKPNDVPVYGQMSGLTSREFAIARTNVYTHLCEAKFHLGFELERIKKHG